MESLIQLLISASGTIFATAVGYVVYRLKKREAKLEAEEAMLRKQAEELRRQEEATRELIVAIAYDRIEQAHRHFVGQGYIPLPQFEKITKLYQAYLARGGNGVVPALHDDLKNLPKREGKL